MAIRYETPEERRRRTGQVDQNRKEKMDEAIKRALDASARKVKKEKTSIEEVMKEEFFGTSKHARAKQKPPVSIRFPQEVLEFFQKDGPGWQGRICTVLSDYVREKTGS